MSATSDPQAAQERAVVNLRIRQLDLGEANTFFTYEFGDACAAGASALRAPGWQPIETAPNDAVTGVTSGTLVTVWSQDLGYGQLYGVVARESKYAYWHPLPLPPVKGEYGEAR